MAVLAIGLLMAPEIGPDLLATTDLLTRVLLVMTTLLAGMCLLPPMISRLLAVTVLTLALAKHVGPCYLTLLIPLVEAVPSPRVACGCSPTSDRIVPLAFLWVPALRRWLISIKATIMLIDLKHGLCEFLGNIYGVT